MAELNEQHRDFLWKAIEYLEGRIALVDNKATFMLGVVGGLFAALAFITGQPTPPHSPSTWVVLLLLTGAFLLACSTVGFLLQVVRKGRFFFGAEVPITRNESPTYFLWPRAEPAWPAHGELLLGSTDTSRDENLVETHFRISQLVWFKYKNLARAMQLLKLLAAWIALSILIVSVLRVAGCLPA